MEADIMKGVVKLQPFFSNLQGFFLSVFDRFRRLSRKQKKISLIFAFLLLGGLYLWFGQRDWFTRPKVSLSFPQDNGQEIPLDSKIEIIFTRPMIKLTVARGLRVNPAVTGKLTWEANQKLIFAPDRPWERGKTYQVSLSSFSLSTTLLPLSGDKSIEFTTLGNPKVVVAAPEQEALEDFSPVTVIFDRPMIVLTTATNSALEASAFAIQPKIAGQGRWLGTTAYQFRPSEPYKRANTYQVTLAADLKSQDGGELEPGFSWQFSSERPHVLQTLPETGYPYASPTASVSAFFNLEMEQKSAAEKFSLVDENGTKIAGRVVVKGKAVGFHPNQPLKREAAYRAVISQGILSQAGPNGMEGDYSWSFQVAPTPAVVRTKPANGETNVGEDNYLEVFFKSPMAEDSFADNVVIKPKPERKPSLFFSSYQDEHRLSIGTYLGRSATYTITLTTGVKDQSGVSLTEPYTFSFQTAPYQPSISIQPGGTYFGAFNQEVTPRLVAKVTNAAEVGYSLFRLSQDQLLELYRRRYHYQTCGDNEACRTWQDLDTLLYEPIRTWQETFEIENDVPVNVVTLVTDKNNNKVPPGFYLVDLKIPQGVHDNMVMIVSRSTLTVKKSDNQILAWVVDQVTGEVVPGMRLSLLDQFGKELTKGGSNGDGVWLEEVDLWDWRESWEKGDLFVFGRQNDDVVVAATAWSQGIDRYDFGLPSYYQPQEYQRSDVKEKYKLFLSLDRPIFRPGQKAYFRGVIRKDNDGAYEKITPDQRVDVGVTDSQGRSIYQEQLPINSFGSFAGEFSFGSEAALGNYRVSALFSGSSFSQEIQVEEYRRPDLAVKVEPNKENYTQGEVAAVLINAAYYFGAPAADLPTTWSVLRQDYSFRWSKDWRFEFGDPESYWSMPWWSFGEGGYFSGEKVTEGQGTTDTRGNLEINLPLDISKQKTSQRLTVEAVVTDLSNQAIAASKEFIVHKGEFYVGLKPVSYGNRAGEEAKVEVVAVDAQGKELADKTVAVEFYKRTWEEVREQNPDDGLFYYQSKPSDQQVLTTSATTDSLGRAIAAFTPAEGGTYKVLAKAVDGRGNALQSGSFLWVSGQGFSSSRENHDRIVVITDKQDYLVGENLTTFVATPFATNAKTLLTVERNNVLAYRLVEVGPESNNHQMATGAKFAPNVYIGAVVVKPGSEVKNPAEFKIGYAEVKVTDPSKQVQVEITPDKSRYKPRETLKVIIETKDNRGQPQPTELAVGLVDKAVWDLSRIEFPDIYKYFYQPRNLGVDTTQLLTISQDRINANTNLGAKGGSGGGCFTGETPVLMTDGLHKSISEVKEGDRVLTRAAPDLPQLVPAKVWRVDKHQVDGYLIINGDLKVTPTHRLRVNDKWQVAGLTQVGDILIGEDNQEIKVFSIERARGLVDVYNLEVETYQTYFAGGVYVHNQKGGFETARREFPETAYWNPHLQTGQAGKAEVEIPLPDNLTTWRLAAIATTDQAAFGSGLREILVSRDVLIRPFVPRFLSIGDEAKLGAIVVNTSGSSQTVVASLQGDGLEVQGSPAQEKVLADGAQTKFTWPTVTRNPKEVQLTLAVENREKTLKDAVTLTLPVKSFSVPEVVATAGQAKDVAEEKIALPKEIDPTQGEATISVSPSLGGASVEALPYLMTYPYDCVEQITSKFLAAVSAVQVMEKAGLDQIEAISLTDLKRLINENSQSLNNLQRADGGWGWWPGSQESDPFITAYVYLGLVEAKQTGLVIADQTLDRAREYLLSQLSGNRELNLNVRAYLLYVLSQEKTEGLASYAANLYERRFAMSVEARAQLALVLKVIPSLGGQAQKVYGEVLSLVKKTATTSHWEEAKRDWASFQSNPTTTAMVLETLGEFDRKNPLIAEVIRYLMTIRRDKHWSYTRETAWILRAMTKLLLTQGDQTVDESFRLSLDGQKIGEGKLVKEDLFKLVTNTLDISQFTLGGENKLRIEKSGQGNLYYNLNLKYFLPFAQIDPLEQGMVVVREFVDSQGNLLPMDKIDEGSEIWTRLIIVAPEERHYVVIEDILPAGLESVNESLKNVSTLNKERPKTKNKENEWWYFEHKEYHDDKTALFAGHLPAGVYEVTYRVRATTPGRYHHPPAQAYQMYVPDVSGHSGGGWLTVEEK